MLYGDVYFGVNMKSVMESNTDRDSNTVPHSSMGGAQLFTRRTAVKVVACLFGLSTVVYVYLYNMSLVNTSTQLLKQRFNISMWARESFQIFHLPNTQSLLYSVKANATSTNSTSSTDSAKEVMPLLTLFTTWPPNDSKHLVRNITLRNWASFKPLVRPIFFSSNGTNTTSITANGWEVLPVSQTAASGTPVLKYMYLDVIPKYKSLFYGYANGDIIFDESLINTLLTVANATVRPDKPIFIIGKRTNVNSVTNDESKDVRNLSKVAKKRGKIFINIAQDFFITDATYPWADIPGVVIGRRAYDNWLVLHSCKQKFTVIDVSNTMLALHQSTKAGNFEGHSHPNSNYNDQLLTKRYKTIRYMAGSTACAPWSTEHVKNSTNKNQIVLSRRKKLDKICYPY